MLQLPGGHGGFATNRVYLTSRMAVGTSGIPEAIALKPELWPWGSYGNARNRVSNRKVVVGGPRLSNGWAPCRPYHRGGATSVGSGMYAGIRPIGASSQYGIYGTDGGVTSENQTTAFGPFMNHNGSTVIPSGLNQTLLTECLAKLGDSKVRLGTAIAESGKTIGMIASRTAKVLAAFRAVRRFKFRHAIRVLGLKHRPKAKTAASFWLEIQYGWLPLLSDIFGGVEAVKRGMSAQHQVVKAVRQRVLTSSELGVPLAWKHNGSSTLRSRCLLFYRVNDPTVALISGLGLANPLEVAWEILPFSFVVDWFIPVGTFLQALSAPLGMTFVDGCISHKVNAEYELTEPPIMPTGYTVIRRDLKYRNVGFSFTRTVISAPGIPVPFVSPNPFSTKRVLNAIALLGQLRR